MTVSPIDTHSYHGSPVVGLQLADWAHMLNIVVVLSIIYSCHKKRGGVQHTKSCEWHTSGTVAYRTMKISLFWPSYKGSSHELIACSMKRLLAMKYLRFCITDATHPFKLAYIPTFLLYVEKKKELGDEAIILFAVLELTNMYLVGSSFKENIEFGISATVVPLWPIVICTVKYL